MGEVHDQMMVAHERAETLQRMATASMRVAQELQQQADQQRRAAENLFRQVVEAVQ